VDDGELRRELAVLVERLHQAPDTEHTAEQVVAYAREQLGADHAGISLIRSGGRLQTVAPTDPVVEAADLLQYELRQGPCFDSTWYGGTLASQDLATDPRWPLWAPKAVTLGIGSALGAELADKSGDRRLGSVNLYWTRARVFTSDEVAFAHLITRHAALALDASLTVEGLNIALDGRKRIGQAQGILMERHGLDEDQAFAVLKRYSQDHNIKLRVLAEQLVATRHLPHTRDDSTQRGESDLEGTRTRRSSPSPRPSP
jgi:GAF domain-containing protein